jgi:ubiquinone/menaquinone biosynthesis C-methylase UbiE
MVKPSVKKMKVSCISRNSPSIRNASEPEILFGAEEGYNRAALLYPRWYWRQFWHRNEEPLVVDWLGRRPPGHGVDAGCGSMPYMRHMIHHAHSCLGVDVSPGMLDQCRPGEDSEMIDFRKGDVCDLPVSTNRADWILCTRVLNHVGTPALALREFARVLRPGGSCFITDLHANHPYRHTRICDEHRQVFIQSYKHSLAELREEAAAQGFVVDKTKCYALNNLSWKPSSKRFEKLRDHPDQPLFYTLELHKAA